MKNKKNAQAISLDLIIGVVIFLLILVVVYSVINTETPKEKKLRLYADSVVAKFEKGIAQGAGLPGIANNDELDEAQLDALYGLSYDEIKSKLGLPGNTEICIVVVDDLGAIRDYNDTKYSFGNIGDNLQISNQGGTRLNCGQGS